MLAGRLGPTEDRLTGPNEGRPSCARRAAQSDPATRPTLTVDVTYTLNKDRPVPHPLPARHHDSSTLSTVLNLTNHSYFNLAGQASGQLRYGQYVQINANRYSPTDTTQIPLR